MRLGVSVGVLVVLLLPLAEGRPSDGASDPDWAAGRDLPHVRISVTFVDGPSTIDIRALWYRNATSEAAWDAMTPRAREVLEHWWAAIYIDAMPAMPEIAAWISDYNARAIQAWHEEVSRLVSGILAGWRSECASWCYATQTVGIDDVPQRAAGEIERLPGVEEVQVVKPWRGVRCHDVCLDDHWRSLVVCRSCVRLEWPSSDLPWFLPRDS